MKKENLKNSANTHEILRGKPAQNDGSGDRAQTHEILRAEAAQNDGKNESGRSMTEMLGVLAVMGVLSVGGISGYTAAMRKHRANEIVSQLNMMAHECSRFYTLSGGAANCEVDGLGFSTLDYAAMPENFVAVTGAAEMKADIGGLEKELCTAVQQRLDDWAVAAVSGECADDAGNTLTVQFKNDLTAWGEGETPSTGAPAMPTCPEGASMDSTTHTGGSFSVTEGTNTIWCYCESEKKYKKDEGKCVALEEDNTCLSWTEKECPNGYYCLFSDIKGFNDPGQGSCEKISDVVEYGYQAEGKGDAYWARYMNGWTAHALCTATGRDVANLQEIGCVNGCTSDFFNYQLACQGTPFDIWTSEIYPNEPSVTYAIKCYADNFTDPREYLVSAPFSEPVEYMMVICM